MFSSQVKFLAWTCLLLATPILLVGCGPKKDAGTVNGRVTIDGEPMSKGTIEFQNQEIDFAMSASIKPDGTYTVKTYDTKGLPPGDYKVVIFGRDLLGDNDVDLMQPEKPSPPKKPIFVRKKYRNADTSGLTATVKNGENEPFNFDLKGK